MDSEIAFFAAATLIGLAAPAFAARPLPALIEVRPDGARTVFTTTSMDRHDRVIGQYADARGALRCCVRLPIQKLQNAVLRTDVSDQLHERRVKAYSLGQLKTENASPFVGAALVFRGRASPEEKAMLAGHADQALPEVCLSSEGAHLVQRRHGKVVTHLYMHFDYSVEPTCAPG